jgi:hypothetical protein
MSNKQSAHHEAISPKYLCGNCKRITSSLMDCKNLERVVCFTCPRRDHFSGDCEKKIRPGNPCWNKNPTNRKEAQVQLSDWKARCDDTLRLLRACHFKMIADALETERPVPREWENEKVANILRDQRPGPRDSRRRLTRLKQQLNAMKKYCLAIFRKMEKLGLAETGKRP